MTELYRDRSKEIRRQNNWTSAEHARMAGLALERLGLLRVAAKKPVEAGEAFFQAEKLFAGPAQHPIGAARLKRNLARAFAATGETTKAVEAFRQFLKVDPPGIEPYVEYLNLLHSDGKTDDAITELTEFIRRKPLEKGLLWLQLAAKVKAGKIDGADAIERFEKLAANSADPALWKE